MATHTYTRTMSISITSGQSKTFNTSDAFSLTAGEQFSKYNISGTFYQAGSPSTTAHVTIKGFNSTGGSWSQSMSFNTDYTNTTYINWTNGNKATLWVENHNSFSVNGTITITFTTTDISYTITKAVSPSGSGTLTTSASTAVKGTSITLSTSANAGYNFSSYSSSPSVTISSNKFTMPASNVTITANFTKKSYAISVVASPSGGGTVTGGGTHQYQASVAITATPATGYQFVNWTKTAGTIANANAASTTYTVPAGTATVTANFSKKSYAISVVASPDGGGTVTGGGTHQYGSSVSITATPAAGYAFVNWTNTAGTIADTTSLSTTFTVPASTATVTANFVKQSYAISVVSSPSTGGTVTGSGTYEYGSTINITATPDEGYHFIGWSNTAGAIADARAASTTFTVPESTAIITAIFAPNTIDYYDGSVFVECNTYYYHNGEFVPCVMMYYDGTNWVPCDSSQNH